MLQRLEKVFVELLMVFIVFGSGISNLEAKEDTSGTNYQKNGIYKVGFRTIFTHDLSRPAIPYSDWDGKLYPTKETKGRQMQINVWYPAKLIKKDTRIKFQHYLELTARQTDFERIDNVKRIFADEQFIAKTNALGGGGAFTVSKLNVLKRIETDAYLNAEAIDGDFPLIVFPNGGSPAFQSVMCEYFASHGFIVVGVALKGQYAFTGDASVKGIETAVSDLDFTINKVFEILELGTTKIGLIGNAITSSQVVAYQTRNSKIDCIVSLEGGLLSQFEQRLLDQTVFYNPQAVDKPILAIYAPHPAIDPKNIDHLRFSDRYFFHFPKMSEFHFLNYGVFEKFVPNIIGKPKGNVQKGFELASFYSLRFFESFLKGNEKSLKVLQKKPTDTANIDKHFIKEALPAPPNITIVKDAFTKEGFSFIERTYKRLKKKNPTPFSRDFYNDIKDWLAWKKDPKFENRFRLYQLALESYPNSATVNYYFAYYALKTDRKELSRKHNQKTLKLLKTDNSLELTNQRKAIMRENIMKDLESLK